MIAHEVGHHVQTLLGISVEEALTAASAIGDDRIQQQTQGEIIPDSFTHGSGEQRVRWFRRGLESGELKACDTFAAASL